MNKADLTGSSQQFSKWETPVLFEQIIDDIEEPLSDQELRQIAHEEGRKAGYKDGLQQGLEDMRQRTEVVEAFISALSQPFNDQNNLLAEEIALLAGRIAKSLVRRELRTEPEIIMSLVRDTISVLNTSEHKINIHLHPDDALIIRQIIHRENQDQHWNLIDDPIISRGDCKIASKDSLISADLQSRINLIIIQFLGDERSENRDS